MIRPEGKRQAAVVASRWLPDWKIVFLLAAKRRPAGFPMTAIFHCPTAPAMGWGRFDGRGSAVGVAIAAPSKGHLVHVLHVPDFVLRDDHRTIRKAIPRVVRSCKSTRCPCRR